MATAVAPETDPLGTLQAMATPDPLAQLRAMATPPPSLGSRFLTGAQNYASEAMRTMGTALGQFPGQVLSTLEQPPNLLDQASVSARSLSPALDTLVAKAQPVAQSFAKTVEAPTDLAASNVAPSAQELSALSPFMRAGTTIGGQVTGQALAGLMMGEVAGKAGVGRLAGGSAAAAKAVPEAAEVAEAAAPEASEAPSPQQPTTAEPDALAKLKEMASPKETTPETPAPTEPARAVVPEKAAPAQAAAEVIPTQEASPKAPPEPLSGARTASGALRENLSGVSTEDLAREYLRMQDAQSSDWAGLPRYGVDPDNLDPDVRAALGRTTAEEFADHEMPNAEIPQFGAATAAARAKSIAKVEAELNIREGAGEDISGIMDRISREGQPANTPAAPAGNWRTANLRLDKFDIDPSGRTEFAAEVQRLKDAGGLQVPIKSFAEQRGEAHAYANQFTEETGLDPLSIDNAKLKRLSGAEIVGLKNVVSRNTDRIAQLSKQLADPRLDASARGDIESTLDQLHTQRDGLLSNIVTAQAEAGRNLGFLRQLSTRSLDPDVWEIQARRVADRPLTDAEMSDIRRLVNEAADACAGVPF
jgi:hypothetical protein